jgi:preprotein translocase subunit SecG
MKALQILFTILIITACDDSSIRNTQELNKNNPRLIKQETQTAPKSLNQESPKERILKIDYKNKIALEETKNRSKEQLATIEAKKMEKLKELELQKAQHLASEKTKQIAIESNKSLQIAQITQKSKLAAKEQEVSLYKILAFFALILFIFWLILRYINQLSKRRHEAQLKEQEYNFEAYKQESQMKHENINKMLDIISSEKSDPSIKKEITKILSHNKGNLIEHKKR